MTAPPFADSASSLIVALAGAGSDPAALDRARTAATARPIDYALGSGESDEVGLFAGIKPLLRQLLAPAEVDRVRARSLALGLHVEETVHLDTPGGPSEKGRVLFIARDPRRARAAAALEGREGHDLEMGLLLGYPRCCLEAYFATPPPRRNPDVAARAAQKSRAFYPRLNVLDLAIFHYVSWLPCAFDCAPSRAYADAIANHIARRHGQFVGAAPGRAPKTVCPPGCRHQTFVGAIDAALSAHRLMLLEDVQVSITGRFDGDSLHVERAWPTARDRHPAVSLSPDALEAAARASVIIEKAGIVTVEENVLFANGEPIVATPDARLFPFGTRS